MYECEMPIEQSKWNINLKEPPDSTNNWKKIKKCVCLCVGARKSMATKNKIVLEAHCECLNEWPFIRP